MYENVTQFLFNASENGTETFGRFYSKFREFYIKMQMSCSEMLIYNINWFNKHIKL